ncbi:hypothetical protein Lsan_2750 [Legionella santicrucis]|uniref:Uncharacterized protein n=1 Tax=Legionella santicrucis TaxID=45074 RepID=A0A0W0YJ71_9GAMM|nr:hypothetical protein [Legionella santicrucis]KTD56590.1 hypothetical protein Lsan_2750 [Legionella santicrucis]
MKKLIIGFFIIASSVGFSATNTDLNAKWICTTNASSSDVAGDKAADDKMANTQGSAAQSFAFAAKNCRDCTKITCEIQE